MIVVEEDRRVGVVVERGDDRVGQRPVDTFVPFVPGIVECAAKLGPRRLVPQRVLDEPQHRVGDDVVVAVVGLGVVRDEDDFTAGLLARDDPILVGRGARDPDHVVLLSHTSQRRDEAAAAASLDPSPVDVVVSDRASVRDDDHR